MKLAGIVFVGCGVLAILFPLVAGVAVEVFYGTILAFAGAAAFGQAWRSPGSENRTGHFLLALIFIATGVLLFAAPMAGLAAFTLLIAIAFFVQGIAQLAFGLGGQPKGNRTWVVASGLLGIAAGAMIFMQWPSTASWVVGLLAGFNLIMVGIAILTARATPGHTPDAVTKQ